MANTELKAVITAEDKASPTLKKVHGSVLDIAKGVALGEIAFQGLKTAVTAVTGALTSTVQSFIDSQKVGAQLDAVLKSTKGAAGLAKNELLSMAAGLQKVTTFSDEAILSAENLLLTFTNIGKDVFPDATKTVLDMSIALGQDTKASAVQLGKALQDPILGITALRRVGVNFTEDQKKQIEVLVESGKTLEAQKLILAELSIEFGGSAEAAGGTFAGAMERLNNVIDDTKEKIGEVIVNAMQPLLDIIIQNQDKIAEWGGRIAEFIAGTLSNLFAWIKDALIPALKEWWAASEPIRAKMAEIGSIIANQLIPPLKEIWERHAPALKIIFEAIGKLQFTALVIALEAVLTVFAKIIGAINNADKAVQNFRTGLSNSGIAQALKFILNPIGFITGKASGGPVNMGQPYIVGEKGPELFVPKSSGNIVPNNQVSNSQNVTIQFTGGVSMMADADVDEIGMRLARQIRLVSQGAA